MTDGNLDNTVRSPGGLSEGAGLRLLYWAIFLFLGAYGNFFPLWLDSAGWTESQMGWLDGMRYACLIVFPLIWGHITDKSGRPVQTIRWIALGSCAAFFFTLWTSAFVPLMITMVVFSAFRVGIVPVTDTFTLSHVERAGGEYGRIRIWGSLGFIVGGFGAAWVIAGTSRASVPNILVALLVATVIVAAILPNRPFLASMQRANTGFRRLWSSSALRRFMVVVLLWRIACQGLYLFLPLHLKNLGVSDAAIPNYWAVGVIAEIVLLRYAKSLFGHLSSRFVMVLCLAAAVLQYGATALVESAFWLYPIMLLHGMTFGIAYYTCVLWLGENVEPQLRTRAQALFQTVGFGVGGLLSSVAAGYLFEVGGGALMFGTSAIVNCVTIFACLWLLRPEKDDSQDVSS